MRVQQERNSPSCLPPTYQVLVPQLTWRNIPTARKNVLKYTENLQKPQNLTKHAEVIEKVQDA